MGILGNIFGSNSSDDDKWIIYTRCAMALAHVDGETSEEEVHGTVARLHQRSGLSNDRVWSIIEKAKNEDFSAAIERAKSTLSEDEKLDLLDFLIGNAHDDGYFHGEEVVFIAWLGVQFSFDAEYLFTHMTTHETYKSVDIKEIEEAMAKFSQD